MEKVDRSSFLNFIQCFNLDCIYTFLSNFLLINNLLWGLVMMHCVRVLLLNISFIIGEAHRQTDRFFCGPPNCQRCSRVGAVGLDDEPLQSSFSFDLVDWEDTGNSYILYPCECRSFGAGWKTFWDPCFCLEFVTIDLWSLDKNKLFIFFLSMHAFNDQLLGMVFIKL